MGFQAEMLSTSRYKSLLKTSDIHHHDTETDRSSQGAHLIQQNLVAQQYDTCPKHNFRSQNRGNPQCQSNPTPPLTPYSKSILTAQFTHPFSAPLKTPRRHARTPEAKRRMPEAGRPPLAKTGAPRPGRATGQCQWPARASNERRGGNGAGSGWSDWETRRVGVPAREGGDPAELLAEEIWRQPPLGLLREQVEHGGGGRRDRVTA
jgi:hypothetical protein